MGVLSFLKKHQKEEQIIRSVRKGWNNPDDIKPIIGSNVEIDCAKYGVRKAVYLDPKYLFVEWRLTDCIHPHQNVNMSISFIQCWRQLDEFGSVTEDAEFSFVEPKQISQ